MAQGELEIAVRSLRQRLGGIKLVKTYTLRRGAYDIAVKHEVVNNRSQRTVRPSCICNW